jgi:selenocysteine lyase/cysteine desulfurase
MENQPDLKGKSNNPFEELVRCVYAALEIYSNVHRGSGHFSMATTHLFEKAREIILEYFGLDKGKYVVIFCSQQGAETLKKTLNRNDFQCISGNDFGLRLGVRALAVLREALPKGAPIHPGGGTARLFAPGWVIWAEAPKRFEAGTPSIINIIALAIALQEKRKNGEWNLAQFKNVQNSAHEIIYNDELTGYKGKELLDELGKTLIGRSKQVPTSNGGASFVNFDYAASTPSFEPVWNAVKQTWRQNETVQHEIVREVKTVCAKMLGAPLSDYDVIFTSNTTEAINLVAGSFAKDSKNGSEPVVLTSVLEHSSNDLPWRTIPNGTVLRLSIDKEGFYDLNELERLLKEYNAEKKHGNKQIVLVALNGASNVLGSFNNLPKIAQIVHNYGAKFLVDAAQLVAHFSVNMAESGIDFLAFSGHKVYAPFGSGALVAKKGILKYDEKEMETIRNSGEENAGGIAGLGKALVLLQRVGLELIRNEEQELTAYTLNRMSKIRGIRIHGIKDPGSPQFSRKGGVIVFDLRQIMPQKIATELAEKGGIGVRSGCHCSHILVKNIVGVGPFIERLQWLILQVFRKLELPGVTRVSFGIGSSKAEVDILIRVLEKIGEKSRDNKNGSAVLTKTAMQKQMTEFEKSISERVYS